MKSQAVTLEKLLPTINFFKKTFCSNTEIEYKLTDSQILKYTVPDSLANDILSKIKELGFDCEFSPSDKRITLTMPQYNNGKALKIKTIDTQIFFVKPEYFSKEEKKNTICSEWVNFFNSVDPEYKSILKNIVDGISISIFKDENGKMISSKFYYIDFENGLQEKKSKLQNGEWLLSYKTISIDVLEVYKTFFKCFEEDLEKLKDFDFFKGLLQNSRYSSFLN